MSPEENDYHFIGIGGIGMSALAHILLEKRAKVSGSDLSLSKILQELEAKGAQVYPFHSSEHVSKNSKVIYNSSITQKNPEMSQAQALNCMLLHRSDLLKELSVGYETLAVTGTHGKTTTTALLASILMHAGKDPTYAIGGHLKQNGLNGHLGQGEFFVLEADESDRTFVKYAPEGAIVTNVEPEHMENYASIEDLHAHFDQFISSIQDQNLFVYCGDDPILQKLARGRGVSFGFSENNQYRIINFSQNGWKIVFDLQNDEQTLYGIQLPLVGRHNALNGAAVFILLQRLGLSETVIREGMRGFLGVKRRQEITYNQKELLFVDDYGHHPTEIEVTLTALKEAVQERRLITLFQPHRYTRTDSLFEEFAHAFTSTDLLFITDIYAASEMPIEGVSTPALIARIKECCNVEVYHISGEQWLEKFIQVIRPHDVILTLGAGSITYYNNQLINHYESHDPLKWKVALFFGGRSQEHLISRRSAKSVKEALNPLLYDISVVAIDQKGNWQIGKQAEDLLTTKEPILFDQDPEEQFFKAHRLMQEADICLPILHGPNGEDGTLQGYFELFEKAYIGPDFRGCAIAMDKVLTKRLLLEAGVPTPPFLSFGVTCWKRKKSEILSEILSILQFPLFVKPVCLGSSVGITRVESSDDLESAIDYALAYDERVLVEQGLLDCRELEFAVVGEPDGYTLSVPIPGEKCALGNFVDYEMKYGSSPVRTTVHPELEPEILHKGQELARQAYCAVGASNFTRVDFLLDPKGQFWCFEVNSIPGLQPLSLFPKIYAREGIAMDRLLDRFIILALWRHRLKKRKKEALCK